MPRRRRGALSCFRRIPPRRTSNRAPPQLIDAVVERDELPDVRPPYPRRFQLRKQRYRRRAPAALLPRRAATGRAGAPRDAARTPRRSTARGSRRRTPRCCTWPRWSSAPATTPICLEGASRGPAPLCGPARADGEGARVDPRPRAPPRARSPFADCRSLPPYRPGVSTLRAVARRRAARRRCCRTRAGRRWCESVDDAQGTSLPPAPRYGACSCARARQQRTFLSNTFRHRIWHARASWPAAGGWWPTGLSSTAGGRRRQADRFCRRQLRIGARRRVVVALHLRLRDLRLAGQHRRLLVRTPALVLLAVRQQRHGGGGGGGENDDGLRRRPGPAGAVRETHLVVARVGARRGTRLRGT